MKLYHGSSLKVNKPDICHSRNNVDFGVGFYATSIYEQAVKWAQKFKLKEGMGAVSVYEFDEKCLEKCNALIFKEYTAEWLDFVSKCRTGKDDTDYEIVMGGMANDNIFNTIELYFDGIITKENAIERLRFEKPSMQICFRSQSVIDTYLRFERSEKI